MLKKSVERTHEIHRANLGDTRLWRRINRLYCIAHRGGGLAFSRFIAAIDQCPIPNPPVLIHAEGIAKSDRVRAQIGAALSA